MMVVISFWLINEYFVVLDYDKFVSEDSIVLCVGLRTAIGDSVGSYVWRDERG